MKESDFTRNCSHGIMSYEARDEAGNRWSIYPNNFNYFAVWRNDERMSGGFSNSSDAIQYAINPAHREKVGG